MSAQFLSRRTQTGVALIEALIGFLIFAVGVLGLVGLQAAMTKAQTGSKVRADAAMLANELIGTMWGDLSANLISYSGTGCASYARCADWQRKVAAALPQGSSTVAVETITRDGSAVGGRVTVTLTWTLPEEGGHRYEMVGVVMPQ